MRLFVCTDHDTIYPVGGAAVVIADSKEQASDLLDAALAAKGLKTHIEEAFTLVEISTTTPTAIILNDGNY